MKPTFYIEPFTVLVSAKISIPSLIGWSCFGVGISIILIYGSLCMIRNASKKHYEIIVKADERVIDVTAIDID